MDVVLRYAERIVGLRQLKLVSILSVISRDFSWR